MTKALYENKPPSTVRKVWSALLTNSDYLPGLLTLVYALRRLKTKFPFVLLFTDSLDSTAHETIDKLGIYKLRLDTLMPKNLPELQDNSRFHETWSKVQIFGLMQFDRIAVLDVDMAVIRNMDELLADEESLALTSEVPLAACHACVCNPCNRPRYPSNWVPVNCAYTYVTKKEGILGPDGNQGIKMINGGLTVIKPSRDAYYKCMALMDSDKPLSYRFPDQELISEAMDGNWIGLSYKYNALKTLKLCHNNVWDDDNVKNVHYIMAPKPWNDLSGFTDETDTFRYWIDLEIKRTKGA